MRGDYSAFSEQSYFSFVPTHGTNSISGYKYCMDLFGWTRIKAGNVIALYAQREEE